jgi:hypothetical protein
LKGRKAGRKEVKEKKLKGMKEGRKLKKRS